MNKLEYLNSQNELFARWIAARPDYCQDDSWFSRDGIVRAQLNFDSWEKQIPKILFLVKEDWSGFSPVDDPFLVKNSFGLNVARWRYLLIEYFRNYKNNPKCDILFPDKNRELILAELTDIAVVEIKKKAEEKTVSPYKLILQYAADDASFLREQIDLINPDIVLCGNTNEAYSDFIYGDDEWTKISEYENRSLFRHGNRLVIDFFHPSCRSSPVKLFFALKRLLEECQVMTGKPVFDHFNWK